MPISECNCCVGNLHWRWEEAFCKFGFMDGDGQVETWNVANVLTEAGYEVTVEEWGMHNTVITHIIKDGIEQIPDLATIGYDDPREYLPLQIIEVLDEKLPSEMPD